MVWSVFVTDDVYLFVRFFFFATARMNGGDRQVKGRRHYVGGKLWAHPSRPGSSSVWASRTRSTSSAPSSSFFFFAALLFIRMVPIIERGDAADDARDSKDDAVN